MWRFTLIIYGHIYMAILPIFLYRASHVECDLVLAQGSKRVQMTKTCRGQFFPACSGLTTAMAVAMATYTVLCSNRSHFFLPGYPGDLCVEQI